MCVFFKIMYETVAFEMCLGRNKIFSISIDCVCVSKKEHLKKKYSHKIAFDKTAF